MYNIYQRVQFVRKRMKLHARAREASTESYMVLKEINFSDKWYALAVCRAYILCSLLFIFPVDWNDRWDAVMGEV